VSLLLVETDSLLDDTDYYLKDGWRLLVDQQGAEISSTNTICDSHKCYFQVAEFSEAADNAGVPESAAERWDGRKSYLKFDKYQNVCRPAVPPMGSSEADGGATPGSGPGSRRR
jgi:hypothetical protein